MCELRGYETGTFSDERAGAGTLAHHRVTQKWVSRLFDSKVRAKSRLTAGGEGAVGLRGGGECRFRTRRRASSGGSGAGVLVKLAAGRSFGVVRF
jgi:hypothetical protein